MHTDLLPIVMFPNFNFIACAEDFISSKVLHNRKYFQENSYDRLHDIIYRPHLSKGINNVSSQMKSCQEIFK